MAIAIGTILFQRESFDVNASTKLTIIAPNTFKSVEQCYRFTSFVLAGQRRDGRSRLCSMRLAIILQNN